MLTLAAWRCQTIRVWSRAVSTEREESLRSFLKTFSTDSIPHDACELTFNRSSGPGGQNVNKLNTKATLRLPNSRMSWLPLPLRENLTKTAQQYLTKEGSLVISSQRNRTQERNKADCFLNLASIIVDAGNYNLEGETSEETKAKVKHMVRKDNENRLKSKKLQSAKKSSRKTSMRDE